MNHKSYSCLNENDSGVYEPQINKWNYQTVPQAVINGTKLRKEKFKTHNIQPEVDVCDFYYNDNCNYYEPRSQFLQHKQKSACPIRRSCVKSSKKCPLRVVELAEPDKRHCIETWRSKFDVLPGIMIDRLKQHVCDEMPIVSIPDALNTFQRKRSRNIDYVSRKKLSSSEVQKYKRLNQIKEMSILFGQKIAMKLKAPLNVTLNSHLQKIANIIESDIELLMRKKVDMTKLKNKIILQEVSGKVAIWIASIIEESSYKILEEELQVEKRNNKSLDNLELITIIQNILNMEQKNISELEEEIGPVFDIMDILINNVIDISETNYRIKRELEKPSSDITQTTTENNEFDISTSEKAFTSEYDTGESNMTINKTLDKNVLDENTEKSRTSLNESETNLENYMDSDDIKTAMEKYLEIILRNILGNEVEEYEKTLSNQESIDKHILITGNTQIGIESTASLSEYLNKIISEEIDNNINALSPSKLSNNLNEEDLAITENSEVRSSNEQLNSNVSATFASIAEEDSDDVIKKVKFSQNSIIDTGITHRNQQSDLNNKMKNGPLSWQQTSNLNIKNSLTFYENLPSSTDEHWPDDLIRSPVKIIADISKSVTSLGNIEEKDEPAAESPPVQYVQDLHEKLNENIFDIEKLKHAVESYKIKDEQNNALYKNATHTKNLDSENKLTGIKERSTDREQLAGKTDIDYSINFKSKSKQSIDLTSQVGEGDQVNMDEKNNIMYKSVIQKLKRFETKFDYKIYPNTAPSWVNGDSGEISVASLEANTVARKQMRDSNIRQWCKNMEYITENLDMWANWINNKCQIINSLKLSTDKHRTYGDAKRKTYGWINLKKNIDNDIEFWTKLRRRHERHLKYNYLPKYSQAQENIRCNRFCQNDSRVLEALNEIENQFSWLHRMIVSTEYAFTCNCKNKK